MLRRIRESQRVSVTLLLCLLVGACVTVRELTSEKASRGLTFSHAKHVEEDMDCTDCHEVEEQASLPDHELCSLCHEIDEDVKDPEACGMCHSDPEWSVAAAVKTLSIEQKFSHAVHVDAEITCAQCHPDPDARRLPKGPVKPFCVDCHKAARAELAECSVCHNEINRDLRPTRRGKARIAHDAQQIWAHTHGQEWRVDPEFCSHCHEDETFCVDCHRTEAPRDHTISWRRKTHGMRASWDRTKCTVCHEEDMCMKCHQNTEPSSHRGSWGGRLNRHCMNCHVPMEGSNCAVCHESVEHRSAKPSVHRLGVYPNPCAMCHPGGNPFRAPHVMNSTLSCKVCHLS